MLSKTRAAAPPELSLRSKRIEEECVTARTPQQRDLDLTGCVCHFILAKPIEVAAQTEFASQGTTRMSAKGAKIFKTKCQQRLQHTRLFGELTGRAALTCPTTTAANQ
jgi:hypothetical protein